MAMGSRAEIPPGIHPAPHPPQTQGWHHPRVGIARVGERLLKGMRDSDLMEEMIANTTMPRFFPLGEHFQLPFPAEGLGKMILP